MIRELPIDTARLNLVSTGHVVPVMPWVNDPANPGRNIPGTDQARDPQSNELLWNVDVLATDQERGETVAVQVAAPYQPVVEQFKPVTFLGLVCRVGVDKRIGQPRQYWFATGVVDQATKPAPKPFGTDSKTT